jgi:hypothetical protein
MTLIRNASLEIHPVIIAADGVSINLYNGSFIDSGFNTCTIPNVVTEPHMMAWKFKISTTPNWNFYYDSFTSSAQGTLNATVANFATGCLGAWHGNSSNPTTFSQTWGKIWFAVYYPFLLSTAQLDQVNSYIAARY